MRYLLLNNGIIIDTQNYKIPFGFTNARIKGDSFEVDDGVYSDRVGIIVDKSDNLSELERKSNYLKQHSKLEEKVNRANRWCEETNDCSYCGGYENCPLNKAMDELKEFEKNGVI